MPRTPKRLYGPALIASGPATVYTVPSTTKTIIRQVHISNPSASPVNLTLSIGTDGTGTRLMTTFSIPAAAIGITNSIQDFFWYQIMEAAEILTLSASTNNILNVVINGDEYTLG